MITAAATVAHMFIYLGFTIIQNRVLLQLIPVRLCIAHDNCITTLVLTTIFDSNSRTTCALRRLRVASLNAASLCSAHPTV